MYLILILILIAILVVAHVVGSRRAVQVAGADLRGMHSLPGYHGWHLGLLAVVPAFLFASIWAVVAPGVIDSMAIGHAGDYLGGASDLEIGSFLRDVRAIAFGGIAAQETPERIAAAAYMTSLQNYSGILMMAGAAALAAIGLAFGWQRIQLRYKARHKVETFVKVLLILSSVIAIITTFGIVLSLIFESLRFFAQVPIWEFLFGLNWSPQLALRADQVGSSGAFGAIPLFAGSLLITAIALSVAVPVGLFAAIYLSDYASPRIRGVAKPLLEILAGVPTVVYGFFAALTVAPFVRDTASSMGLSVSSESALAAGIVMGIMIIPFVSSLSDDVINAVPQSLRDGSMGLGATKSETIRKVVLPAALPGIVSAVILAFSKAIGETMIVVMAAGLAANLTINPLDAVTTVTVQIATLLVGDQEFDSPKTLAAFALGLLLFVVTLILNMIALRIVHKYREQYD
ncbi:MAG: phosphate ABC transporter permease subunit PstC [Pseudomonadota bacterium]